MSTVFRRQPVALRLVCLALSILAPSISLAHPSLGLPDEIVSSTPSAGSFPLVTGKEPAPVWYDSHEYAGVVRAIADLQSDIYRVTSQKPLAAPRKTNGRYSVIVGTLGHNAVIDELAASGKFNTSELKGKRETFVITTMDKPVAGIDRALVIAGSDKRGTIYGIYELSEQLGVSPWYWWADVPPKKRKAAYVLPGTYNSGEPVVRYRGIFLNDERPCLTGWASEKFGGLNSTFYARVFELLLRLRANYLWPAMWDNAFYQDDADNARLANEYGIIMGTSHHEPMMRAHKEWTTEKKHYGNGEWNYKTNADGLKTFFREGIARTKDYENLITIGMRGDGDEAMASSGNMASDTALLRKIFADQRQIIAEETHKDPAETPQLWALFTEVQKYYEHGLRPPDDVTLLWTDDNTGNLRRLPPPEERTRSGGSGIYYHFDMHGGPFAYQWINTNPFEKISEQMNLAASYGADRIWIVNVGDLKPLELPIEFFMRMAWNPKSLTRDKISAYTRRWAERDFGPEHASDIADIVTRYTKYNGWRKPELVKPDTFSPINYFEADRVEAKWLDLVAKAEKLYGLIPAGQRDAYYQLVLHPAKASALVGLMNIAAGKNHLYAHQGRFAAANAQAARVRDLFRQDKAMSDYYNHELAGGKWNHLMDQAHLGEVTWQPPNVNVMPAVSELLPSDNANYGVAIEGNVSAWPEHYGDAVLPAFDSLNPRRSYVDVFAEGNQPIRYAIKSQEPWVRISKDPHDGQDSRYWVDIDWEKAPVGESVGTLTVTGSRDTVTIKVPVTKASEQARRMARGRFSSLTGPIAIDAADADFDDPVDGVNWGVLPNYGRGEAALSIYPVTSASILPPNPSPTLEYPVYLPRSGTYEITLILGPVMDFVPDRGMRIATALDDGAPKVSDIFSDRARETFLGDGWWNQFTRDNARYLKISHAVSTPGAHTLKISMVDPGIVLQKIIISDRSLPASYFGPPSMTKSR